MAIENGLKPSFRGFKGVGFNRPLPATFGFGNSFVGDTVNDYFLVPEAAGEILNDFLNLGTFSIEFWVKPNAALTGGRYAINFNVAFNKYLGIAVARDAVGEYLGVGLGVNESASATPFTSGVASHLLLSRGSSIVLYGNGIRGSSAALGNISSSINLIGTLQIGAYNVNSFSHPIDELRLYNKELSQADATIGFNQGSGANPIQSEFLKLWFNFEKAEIATDLYPSGLPIGWLATDWGIRNLAAQDSWPKKYHARAVNMTNNATLGGVLRPW